MLDFSHIPTPYGSSEVFYFEGGGGGNVTGDSWILWNKPRGKSMCNIMLVAKGGNGGSGAIGANSTAAGGGGGSSASQTIIRIPTSFLPDTLYLALPGSTNAASQNAYVSIQPNGTAANCLVFSTGGNVGGNATGATAGTAGAAASAATAANMPLGWGFLVSALAGQAGIAGGTNVAAGGLSLPTTGLLVTGGGGGGGLPAAATAGTRGTTINGSGVFPTYLGSVTATATVPAGEASHGTKQNCAGMLFNYGGCGSGSTHGSATGTGLVQSNGGNGAPGCGGGGTGGALTGSTAGTVGLGGLTRSSTH